MTIRWLILWSLVLLTDPAAATESIALTLPPWQALTFELPPALVVKTQIQTVAATETSARLVSRPEALQPGTAKLLHLIVDTRLKWFLATKTWHGELWLQPDSTALQRTRLNSGRERTYKIYRYGKKGVYRIRRKPPNGAGGPSESWPVDNEHFYAYPPSVTSRCRTVSDPYVLLLYLSQAQIPDQSLCLFNKRNVYEVRFVKGAPHKLEIRYEHDGDLRHDTIEAESIRIQPTLIESGDQPAEPFEFLGMEGVIQIMRDPERRLPLQMEGEVPGFGHARLRLTRVRSHGF